MSEIITYIEKASSGSGLSKEESERAFQIITSGGATPAQIAGLLLAIKTKGETASEISGAVNVMRHRMVKIDLPENIRKNLIDCCGTGGDKKGSLNISTAVAFVLAACGLYVAKHGNRAVSSQAGSSDVLSALGVNTEIKPEQTKECIEKVGIGFLFAPTYHRSLASLAPIRRELGVRTIFNVLGPLCNPASPKFQLIGVYSEGLVRKAVEVVKDIGLYSALIVNGFDGSDEISISGKSYAAELTTDGEIKEYQINPEEYGLKLYGEDALNGGDAKYNSKQMYSLFGGNRSAYYDSVILNSAFALKISGKVISIEQGLSVASKAIDSGAALEKLKSLVEISNSFI